MVVHFCRHLQHTIIHLFNTTLYFQVTMDTQSEIALLEYETRLNPTWLPNKNSGYTQMYTRIVTLLILTHINCINKYLIHFTAFSEPILIGLSRMISDAFFE